MHGKIVDLYVSENDEITEGDSLFILEALKMQNEVLSNVTGKVKKIYFKIGDTIMKDDILIELNNNNSNCISHFFLNKKTPLIALL